eukprot:g32783.t1
MRQIHAFRRQAASPSVCSRSPKRFLAAVHAFWTWTLCQMTLTHPCMPLVLACRVTAARAVRNNPVVAFHDFAMCASVAPLPPVLRLRLQTPAGNACPGLCCSPLQSRSLRLAWQE